MKQNNHKILAKEIFGIDGKNKNFQKRLESMKPVLDSIAKRVLKCPVTKLMDFHCPKSCIPSSFISQIVDDREKPITLFSVDHEKVFNFTLGVVNSLIKKSLWGSSWNYLLFKKRLKLFVNQRRFESLPLSLLVSEMKVNFPFI